MPRPMAKKENSVTGKEPSPEKIAESRVIESGLVPVVPTPTQIPVLTEDTVEGRVLYEAIVDGKSRYYPATTATPRKGKFYGIRTFEDDDRSRILISQKDYNESFPFSDGPVLTKYGIGQGKTCNITLKLVDVILDVTVERVIGVYLVVMTPSFAIVNVDAVKLVRELEQKDIGIVKEAILTHEALMLKFQLQEAMKQAETYRQALFDRDTNIVKLAEDFAAPIIETTLSSLAATRDMFDEYFKQKEDQFAWFRKNWKYLFGAFVAGVIVLMWFLGPGGG